MPNDWLTLIAMGSLVAGTLCAAWLVLDVYRHPQTMWIMNVGVAHHVPLCQRLCVMGLLSLWPSGVARPRRGGRRKVHEEVGSRIVWSSSDSLWWRLYAGRFDCRMVHLLLSSHLAVVWLSGPLTNRRCLPAGASILCWPSRLESSSSISRSCQCETCRRGKAFCAAIKADTFSLIAWQSWHVRLDGNRHVRDFRPRTRTNRSRVLVHDADRHAVLAFSRATPSICGSSVVASKRRCEPLAGETSGAASLPAGRPPHSPKNTHRQNQGLGLGLPSAKRGPLLTV